MENDIFDEVEHWIKFIKLWELENDDKLPDEILYTLEMAFEKAISSYKDQTSGVLYDKYFH